MQLFRVVVGPCWSMVDAWVADTSGMLSNRSEMPGTTVVEDVTELICSTRAASELVVLSSRC